LSLNKKVFDNRIDKLAQVKQDDDDLLN